MSNLVQELRSSIRSLAKSKGFTLAAVLILALGIGANTAIFSVLNAVVLQPLPYEEPDQLVFIWATDQDQGKARGPVMPAELLYWREQADAFDGIAAFLFWSFTLTGRDEPESLTAAAVTPNLFPLLRIEAALGRTFTEEEGVLGPAGNVVLLSHGLWQRRFGGDPEVLGTSLVLDGQSHVVVGILPPGFDFPHRDVELWMPLAFNSSGGGFRRPSISVIARLRPSLPLRQAQEVMDVVSRRLEEEFPATNTGRRTTVVPLQQQMLGSIRPILLSLFAGVGVLLVIACVNVGNLMLARALAKQSESALRKALGASWLDLLRRPLLEGLLLAFLGGAAGLAFAGWELRLLTALSPAEVPRLDQARLDLRVLGFTLAVSLVAALFFTLLPAIKIFRSEPRQLIKEKNLDRSGSHWTSQLLIVSEVALVLILLLATGLILRNMAHLQKIPRGFKDDNVLVAQVVLPEGKYPDDRPSLFFHQLRERLEGLPGVVSAAATSTLPIRAANSDFEVPFTIEGRPRTADALEVQAQLRIISHGYTETLGIAMVNGRSFTSEDRQNSPPVALINQTMAERFWPDAEPIGDRLNVTFQGQHTVEIVGVMADVQPYGAVHESQPEIFLPLEQVPFRGLTVLVATSTAPLGFADAFKTELWTLDREQPVPLLTSLRQLLADSLASQRFHGMLMTTFAVTALILAVVGTHGVMSQIVSHRTRDIGLRMALGARPSDILRSVVGRAFLWMAWGIGCALVLTMCIVFTFEQSISRLLQAVSPTDPVTFAGAVTILAAVCLAGSYLPARRAAQVDPIRTLRHE